MLQLPAELQRLCIEYLDDDADTLKVVRLVNNELGNLATEVLFSKAILNPTDESAEKFMELMQDKFSDKVRCVVINTSLDPDLEDEEAGALPESEVLPSFADAIGSLSSFRNLQELQLKFALECAAELDTDMGDGYEKEVAETPEFRNEVLKMVFEALEEITTLDVLSIKNLQDHMDREILESEAFHRVRDKLTGLHLQITTEAQEQHELELAAIHRGFTTDLPELWLKPTLSHLTHLTLYSYTCMWGVFPFVDFRDIGTFPCLQSLSLGNLTIAYDWQFDWIVSHGPTLKQLLLDDCPIIAALKMEGDMAKVAFPELHSLPESMRPDWNGRYFTEISLRWHDVFDRFRSGLPHLEHFAACGSEHWTNDAFDDRYYLRNRLAGNRYHVFDCGTVPPWLDFDQHTPVRKGHNFYRRGVHPNSEEFHVDFPECYDEDMEALDRLMKVVNERARVAV
ncbi:hypothetical protein N0V95_008644 [Ascochyta clinopodiicola]|nr:hypothetical protein N0V95_008644 [Ascochyta clinopodiicola]